MTVTSASQNRSCVVERYHWFVTDNLSLSTLDYPVSEDWLWPLAISADLSKLQTGATLRIRVLGLAQ